MGVGGGEAGKRLDRGIEQRDIGEDDEQAADLQLAVEHLEGSDPEHERRAERDGAAGEDPEELLAGRCAGKRVDRAAGERAEAPAFGGRAIERMHDRLRGKVGLGE